MKSRVALIATLAALAAFATSAAYAADAADTDKKYTKEEFKSDVKDAGKGVKDAAKDVGHQVGSGTKKAYKADKAKIKKDVKDGKPGDGSLAKKNDSQPVATPGHNYFAAVRSSSGVSMMTGIPMGCRFLFVEEAFNHDIHRKGRKGREGKTRTRKAYCGE